MIIPGFSYLKNIELKKPYFIWLRTYPYSLLYVEFNPYPTKLFASIFSSKSNTMKHAFLIALLFPVIGFSQKIALIDRQLSKPIVYVDAVNYNQIQKGYFMIYEKDMNSVIEGISSIRTQINSEKGFASKPKNFVTGNTYFSYFKKGRKYEVAIDTKSNMMGSYYILVDQKKSADDNLQQIDKLLSYLKSDKSS